MKRIVVDARHLSNEYSGLGRYSASLIFGFLTLDRMISLVILLPILKVKNSLILVIEDAVSKSATADIEYVDIPLFGLRHHVEIGFLDSVRNADAYIYPHFDVPLSVRKKTLYVCHDTFVLDVDGYITRRVIFKKFYFWLLHNYQALRREATAICISDSTKVDLAQHILKRRGRCSVVRSKLIQFAEASEPFVVPEKFFLYVGDRRPHKNLRHMIEVFSELVKQHKFKDYSFVIAGSDAEYGEGIDDLISKSENVLSLTNVSERRLRFLYEKTECLFFWTKYEGFGLPIYEAWANGRRIVTSNCGGAAEIAPKGSLKIAPTISIADGATVIADYLNRQVQILEMPIDEKDWSLVADVFLKFAND